MSKLESKPRGPKIKAMAFGPRSWGSDVRSEESNEVAASQRLSHQACGGHCHDMANATLKSQHYDCLRKDLTRRDTLALPSEGSQVTQGSVQGTCTHKTSWGAPPLLLKIKANDGWKRGFSSVV